MQPQIIHLPKFLDPRGNLTFLENGQHIPFKMKRVYWVYDVPGGEIRGSHAFKEQQEFIIALSGSFDVLLDNGKEKFRFSLNRSYMGLYVPNMHWRSLENFSTNSLAMILTDKQYNANEYIRDYQTFINTQQ
jgi:dTDP-4-dehydrorhamnose 3,5-epimerase-like enzyme